MLPFHTPNLHSSKMHTFHSSCSPERILCHTATPRVQSTAILMTRRSRRNIHLWYGLLLGRCSNLLILLHQELHRLRQVMDDVFWNSLAATAGVRSPGNDATMLRPAEADSSPSVCYVLRLYPAVISQGLPSAAHHGVGTNHDIVPSLLAS